MSYVGSIIDEGAVDPHAAAAALARFDQRIREGVMGAGLALAVGCVAVLMGNTALAIPCAAGALAGLLVAGLSRSDRGLLIERLIGQRSAYAIPAVASAASKIATMDRRRRLARTLTRAALAATGLEPASETLPIVVDRAQRHAGDLLGIAFLLAREGVKVHPASIALLERLTTHPTRSPLLAARVPEQHLRIALQRVRASIDA